MPDDTYPKIFSNPISVRGDDNKVIQKPVEGKVHYAPVKSERVITHIDVEFQRKADKDAELEPVKIRFRLTKDKDRQMILEPVGYMEGDKLKEFDKETKKTLPSLPYLNPGFPKNSEKKETAAKAIVDLKKGTKILNEEDIKKFAEGLQKALKAVPPKDKKMGYHYQPELDDNGNLRTPDFRTPLERSSGIVHT